MEREVHPRETEAGAAGGAEGAAGPHLGEQPGAGSPPDVREVVGRRGYDEAEDETATEEEEH